MERNCQEDCAQTEYFDLWHDTTPPALRWVSTMALFAICTTGIVTNIISFLIFLLSYLRRSSINILFAALSMSDLVMLVCFIPKAVYSLHVLDPSIANPFAHASPWPAATNKYIRKAAQTCSVWICLAITCERYRAICRPMAHRPTSTRKTVIVLLAITVSALIFNILHLIEPVEITSTPIRDYNDTIHDSNSEDQGGNYPNDTLSYLTNTSLEYSNTKVTEHDYNDTQISYKQGSGYSLSAAPSSSHMEGWKTDFELSLEANYYYMMVYPHGVYWLGLFFVPFPIVLTLNLLVMRRIRKSVWFAKLASRKASEENASNRMIMLLTGLLAFSLLPSVVGSFIRLYVIEDLGGRQTIGNTHRTIVRVMFSLHVLGYFIQNLNSGLPFFIYLRYCRKFRDMLVGKRFVDKYPGTMTNCSEMQHKIGTVNKSLTPMGPDKWVEATAA